MITSPNSCFGKLAMCFVAIVTLPPLNAQNATEKDGDDVLELSPFVVTSDEQGYVASQTLAGSRMKTALRDVSSPVSVLTPDFLQDIDATDINEALKFIPSVDDDDRGYNSLINNPVSTRVRGFLQISQSQNYFDSRVTADRYNVDRIEINRGPNAILFGIGNPGGLFTSTTKNALFGRDFGSTEARFDTYGSWRFSGDWNQSVIKDRFAVRVAAMKQDKKGDLDPTSNKEDRLYLALSAKLVDTGSYDLSARYQFEYADQSNNLPSYFSAVDFVTTWQNAGSPTYASAGQVPVSQRWPAGMQGIAQAFQLTPIMTGSGEFSSIMAFGNRPGSVRTDTSTGAGIRLGTPASQALIPGTNTPIPVDLNFQGPRFGATVDATTHNLFVEQTFFNKLNTELSYFYQEPDREWDRTNGAEQIYVDILRTLPDGSPNPNVNKLFAHGNIRIQDEYRELEVARFTAGYTLDFRETSKWLGQHNIGFLLESSRSLLGLNDSVEVNLLSAQHANNLTVAGNRVFRRYYLFNGTGNVFDPKGSPGAVGFRPLSGTIDKNSAKDAGLPFKTGLANMRVLGNETQIDSYVLSLQSFLLNGRLVTFGGIRGDDLSEKILDDTVAAARLDHGIYPSWDTIPMITGPNALDDETYTWGVIGRILPNVGVFYNASEILSLGDSRPDLFGNPNPISTGEGWDAGVRFELLGGKLIGSVTFFETSQINVPIYNTLGGQDGSDFNNFLDGLIELQTAGLVPNLDYSSRMVDAVNPIDTYNNEATGVEFEVTYNPISNWRLAFKATKQENKQSGVIESSYRFANENIYSMQSQLDGSLIVPTTNRSITTFYSDLDREVAREKFSREGVITPRLPEWQWNLVTNYRFTEGRLKGFSVGGSTRYVGEKNVTALLNPDGSFTGDYVTAREQYLVGLNVGYSTKLSSRVTLELRLYVDNVFDRNDPDLQMADPNTGEIIWNRFTSGRSAAFSTTLRF